MDSATVLYREMQGQLSRRRQLSTLRSLSQPSTSNIDFSSNDFLSLARSPILRRDFLRRLSSVPSAEFRLGSGGSRLLDGNSAYAEQLEQEIAAWHGAPAGLLANSGYDANVGLFTSVPQQGSVIVYDSFIHASVHEGMRQSRAETCVPFAHNDIEDLRRVISVILAGQEGFREGKNSIFVAVEALYSMDGDSVPLREVLDCVDELLPRGNGYVCVDEAHSTGLFGSRGRGLVSELGLESRVFARLHTFGKALACNGAVILCQPVTREYLINYARPLIYTTFMSFPTLAAIKSAFGIIFQGKTEPLVTHLRSLITHLDVALSTLISHQKSLDTLHSTTTSNSIVSIQLLPKHIHSPIFALLTKEPRDLARHCQAAGYVVRAIVPPTVPEGGQRIRICLHAANTIEQIDGLVRFIEQWLAEKNASKLERAKL